MNLDNQQPMEDFSDDASIAKADLYKAGKYSIKLIKMLQDGQELPAWVQAKITKAADYIASVYHHLEFDIKKSEFGEHIDNADMYESHLRNKFEQKLMEAKKNPKKPSEKVCKEECSSCEESCDKNINEGPYLGTILTTLKHPKYGKLELVNLGSFMMIVGEPSSDFQDVKADSDTVRHAWKKLLKDVETHKMHKGGFRPMQGAIRRSSTDESRITEKAKPTSGTMKKDKPAVKPPLASKDAGKKPVKGFQKVEKSSKKG
jgi:hypothetical protein